MKIFRKKNIIAAVAIILLWAVIFPYLASLKGFPGLPAYAGTPAIAEASDELVRVSTNWDVFYYNDRMLLDRIGSNECSGEISLASVGLAAAAYDDKKTSEAFRQMGFSELYRSPYYSEETTYDNNNVVAYCLFEKYVRYAGELYRIIALPVRGTPESCEWYSNFDIGTGSRHHGFYTAAEEVLQNLRGVLQAPVYDADHTVLWTTGHSRGAAVANIVAGELSTDAEWKPYISADHIFGYTFACPGVSTTADTTLCNIYNYNNGGDVVPALPLAGWGYKRFGQTMNLPAADYDNLCSRYKIATGEDYTVNMSTAAWEDILMTIAPTQQQFVNNDVIQFAVDLLCWFMGGKKDRSHGLVSIILSHAETASGIWNELIKIRDFPVIEFIHSIKEKSPGELLAKLDEGKMFFEEREKEIINAINTANTAGTDWSGWAEKNSGLVDFCSRMSGTSVASFEDLEKALEAVKEKHAAYDNLVGIVRDVMSLYFDTDGHVTSAFTQGHSQDTTYTMWVNSMYFGYTGWFCNQEITSIDWKDQIQRTYVGDYCFYGCPNLREDSAG